MRLLEEEEVRLMEAEFGDVQLNSAGQKASDFEPNVEDNDCNNVEPESVELREHVMHNEASTYSSPLLSRTSKRVYEWETDVAVGNFIGRDESICNADKGFQPTLHKS